MIARILTCCILIIPFVTNGQTPQLDQRRRSVSAQPTTAQKAMDLHQLVNDVSNYDLPRSISDAEYALEVTSKLGLAELQSQAMNDLAYVHYLYGENDEARRLYQRSLLLAKKENLTEAGFITRIRIANFWRAQGRMDSTRIYLGPVTSIPNVGASATAFYYQNAGWLAYQTSHYRAALQLANRKIGLGFNDDGVHTLKALAYLKLGLIDSAEFFVKKTFEIPPLADSIIDRNETFNYITYGDIAFRSARYSEALEYFKTAYEATLLHGYTRLRARTSYRLGHVYELYGNHPEAIDHYYEGLELYGKLTAIQEIAKIKARLSWAYIYSGNIPLSIKYADESLAQMKSVCDSSGTSFAWNLLGHIAFKSGDLNRATLYYDSAMIYRSTGENRTEYYNTLFNRADVLSAKGRDKEALDLLLEIKEAELANTVDVNNLLYTIQAIGDLHAKMNNFRLAEENYSEAIAAARQAHLLQHLRNSLRGLSRLYINENLQQKALVIFSQYLLVDDSLSKMESREGIARLSALRESKIKEREMARLQTQNELKELQNKLASRRLNMLYILLTCLLVLVTILILYLVKRAQMSKETHAINYSLREKNEEIQSMAEELGEANRGLANFNVALEKRILERTDELTKANHDLETYFYRASHDLRGPVSTLLGIVNLSQMESMTEESHRMLFASVADVAAKQLHLIDKLLQLSEVLMIQDYPIDQTNLASIVEESVNFLLQSNKGVNVTIKVDVEPITLSVPRILIKAILHNLIENAITFRNGEHPEIMILAHRKDDKLIVQVTDNGDGIDEKIQPLIFNMFYRGSIRSQGNGLGLYIIKRAADKLSGTMRVESFPHQKTTFRVEIPLDEQPLGPV